MRYVAGQRPRRAEEVMHIDYADVLKQAVENERHNVLREVRKAIAAVPTKDHKRGDSWNRPDREVDSVIRDILAAVDRVGAQS